MYRLNRYINTLEENGLIVLYNYLTCSLFYAYEQKDPELYEYLKGLVNNKSTNHFPCQELVERLFLLEEDVDEYDILKRLYDKKYYKSDTFQCTILVNELCNFQCVYCYEHNDGHEMTAQVCDGVMNFIVDKVLSKGYKEVLISWFGGEPLLSVDLIISFLNKLRSMLPDIHIRSAMTTNGYLLNDATFYRLYEAGVREYQITVDGMPYMHDRYRMLRGGGATFDKIWGNIINISKTGMDVSILIRVNFNEEIFESIFELMDTSKKFIDQRFTFHFHPIANMSGDTPADLLCSSDFLYVANVILGEYCLENGIRTDMFSRNMALFQRGCYANDPNYYAIDPEGNIIRCTVAIKDECNIVGKILSVDNYEIYEEQDAKWTRNYKQEQPECQDCACLPVCYGWGCPYHFILGKPFRCDMNIFLHEKIMSHIAHAHS